MQYKWHLIFTSPSFWGLLNFRIAQNLWSLPRILKIFYYLYFPIWRFLSLITGIEIYGKTKIGKGLRIHHFGGIFINPKSIIGNNCEVYNNVTIGSNKFEGGKSPIIGDNVKIGVGAKVLGGIKIGNNVLIGANAVVTKDIPDSSVAVGNPAKISMYKDEK